jgi:hypothetical protein
VNVGAEEGHEVEGDKIYKHLVRQVKKSALIYWCWKVTRGLSGGVT